MYMELEPTAKQKRAEPEHISSYEAFKEWVGASMQESELHRFQKYHGAKELMEAGLQEVYVNAAVRFLPDGLRRFIDACGFSEDRFITVLCEAGASEDISLELLGLLGQSSNVEAIWIYPLFDSDRVAYRRATKPQSRKKVKIERGTLEHLEDFFEGALEALELFESEARMRMLFAMWESPRDKRFFRELVNPKLLYENLEILQRTRLIREVSKGVYGLSGHGESLMQEYLFFLDKIRRAMRDL